MNHFTIVKLLASLKNPINRRWSRHVQFPIAWWSYSNRSSDTPVIDFPHLVVLAALVAGRIVAVGVAPQRHQRVPANHVEVEDVALAIRPRRREISVVAHLLLNYIYRRPDRDRE